MSENFREGGFDSHCTRTAIVLPCISWAFLSVLNTCDRLSWLLVGFCAYVKYCRMIMVTKIIYIATSLSWQLAAL